MFMAPYNPAPSPCQARRGRLPVRDTPTAGAPMPEAFFTVLEDRGILAVSGEDRRSFLQGLVSNDTAKISAERAVYAALLTAQGKYLHDFMLVEHGDTIWLDGEAARLADLR